MKRTIFILLCVVVIPILIAKWVNRPRAIVEPENQNQAVESNPGSEAHQDPETRDPDDVVAALVDSEALIRKINPVLKTINKATRNLHISRGRDQRMFADPIQLRDIESIQPNSKFKNGQRSWSIQLGKLTQPKNEEHDAGIWNPLLDHVDYFETSKLYAIKVSDRSSLPQSFVTEVGFEGLARTKNRTWLAITAHGMLNWEHKQEDRWVVTQWDLDTIQVTETAERLFEDVSKKCLSPEDAQLVQHSKHFELLTGALTTGPEVFQDQIQKKYFPHIATGRHPSLSVVDIDNDGWDDLYVVEQWRKNMLFRNLGDGTFEECAADFRLDIPGYGTSAVFSDFDNDGDPDLFLGKSLRRSQYLENIDGQFTNRSDRFLTKLPFLVSSLSASDFNGDGLVDLYVSTYGFLTPNLPPAQWTRQFLPLQEQQYVMQLFRAPGYNRYLNAAGPANLLFENRGDHFRLSQFNPQVNLYANTLQSTWTDYDNDGDPDLYVANDFARDYLLRNDGVKGFTDVTLEVGDETMMGFGMGASWGDYDLDGRQDLYVSNMYSKAGLRILEQFDHLDPQFRRSADGNRLYKNSDEGLRLVSANAGPGLNVHKAGWSWGGQFIDVDNDSFLDLYVTSGYFTAPRRFASDKDL